MVVFADKARAQNTDVWEKREEREVEAALWDQWAGGEKNPTGRCEEMGTQLPNYPYPAI